MSICLYIFIIIMTLVSVFVMFAAINAYLKSHDKLFNAIEKLKQTKVSNTNELSWKPSDEQMNALYNIIYPCDYVDKGILESLYNDLLKNYKL